MKIIQSYFKSIKIKIFLKYSLNTFVFFFFFCYWYIIFLIANTKVTKNYKTFKLTRKINITNFNIRSLD